MAHIPYRIKQFIVPIIEDTLPDLYKNINRTRNINTVNIFFLTKILSSPNAIDVSKSSIMTNIDLPNELG